MRRAGGWRLRLRSPPDLDMHLSSTRPMDGLTTTVLLHRGERLDLVLRWSGAGHRHTISEPTELLAQTASAWRSWAGGIAYDGPEPEAVRRSAVTLKLLDHFASGAIVAARTCSLPESIGGVRNWD